MLDRARTLLSAARFPHNAACGWSNKFAFLKQTSHDGGPSWSLKTSRHHIQIFAPSLMTEQKTAPLQFGPKPGEKSELCRSRVHFTVQQSAGENRPELNSLNSSDILHLSGAGNALRPAGRVSLINERSAPLRGPCNADRTAGDGADGSQLPATAN